MRKTGADTGLVRIRLRYRTTFWEVRIRFLGNPQAMRNVSSPQLSEPIAHLLPVLGEDAQADEQEHDLQAVC
jgi:hypothetical protein